MAGHSYVNANLAQIKHIQVGSTKIKKAHVFKNDAFRQVWSGASLVTYHLYNGATHTEEVDEGQSVLGYSAPAVTGGWNFLGWREDTTASATVLTSKIATGEPIHLYAMYRRTVTVSYSGNGQTGGSTSASTGYAYMNVSGTKLNASITLRANGFSKTGWTFKGWGTSSSADATVSSYSGTSDVTRYAIWKQSYTLASTGVRAYDMFSFSGNGSRESHDWSNPSRWEFAVENSYNAYGTFSYNFDRKHCNTLTIAFQENDYGGGTVSFGTASKSLSGSYGTVTLDISGQPQTAALKFYVAPDWPIAKYQVLTASSSFS